LEGEKYITHSLILLQLCQLEMSLETTKQKYSENTCPQIHAIIQDLEESLCGLWDRLPIDSVISSILDPRVKFLTNIPSSEIEEALEILKKEYDEFLLSYGETIINKGEDDLSGLFSIVKKQNAYSPSWDMEISSYKREDPIPGNLDPLDWWKINEKSFPILSKLAKCYLAMPASQATAERLFSIGKDIMSEKRTLLSPDLFEALVLTSKYFD